MSSITEVSRTRAVVTFRLDPEIDSYRIEYFDHERPAELNKLFEAPVQPVDDLNYDVALDDLKPGEILT